MPLDTVLTLLNVVWGLILTGIGIEMVNNPPDTRAKKWTYRVLFAVFGLAVIVTTAYQSVRNATEQQRLKAEAEKTERELSNKVSEQSGKLDAIAHFESQFLTFVSQRPSGDATTKAYEAMALTIMRTAQGPAVQSQDNLRLKQRACVIAEHIRMLAEREMGEELGRWQNAAAAQGKGGILATATEGEKRNWQDQQQKLHEQARQDFVFEYNDKYKRDALKIREQLLEKLPPGTRNDSISPYYEQAGNYMAQDQVASELEQLASLIPDN
jgi:hypothetical protein